MPRRADTEQVDAAARAAAMGRGQRRRFGIALEDAKAHGESGTKNARGDFTMRELRAAASELPVTGVTEPRGATHVEAARHVEALVGASVSGALVLPDDRLELAFGPEHELDAATWWLRLAPAAWALTRDDEFVARAGDEPGHALQHLQELSVVTHAALRRRDAAIELRWEDDPFGAAFSLVVPGRRGRAVARWELATPGGLLVVAHGDGAISVGPDDGSAHG